MQDRRRQFDEIFLQRTAGPYIGSIASVLARPKHVRLGGNLGIADCPVLPVEGFGLNMIQASKAGPRIMRYELTDFEWAAESTAWYGAWSNCLFRPRPG
jgi:hypothetical protein